MSFPFQWMSKEGLLLGIDKEKKEAYFDFEIKACEDDDLFFAKLGEELKKRGISLSVDDGTYNFTTKDRQTFYEKRTITSKINRH